MRNADDTGESKIGTDRARQYSRYCGAAALANVKGISRVEAGGILAAHPDQKDKCGWVYMGTLEDVLGIEAIWFRRSERPTLAKWLREDGRDALLFVSRHFVVVRGGQVVEDNGYTPRRGRVKSFVLLQAPTDD